MLHGLQKPQLTRYAHIKRGSHCKLPVQLGQSHAVILRNYHYTSSGNLEGIDDLNKGSARYFYNAIDRLKEVDSIVNEQFDFDPANNLILQSEQPKADHQTADSSSVNADTAQKAQRFDEHSKVFSLDKAREKNKPKVTAWPSKVTATSPTISAATS